MYYISNFGEKHPIQKGLKKFYWEVNFLSINTNIEICQFNADMAMGLLCPFYTEGVLRRFTFKILWTWLKKKSYILLHAVFGAYFQSFECYSCCCVFIVANENLLYSNSLAEIKIFSSYSYAGIFVSLYLYFQQ